MDGGMPHEFWAEVKRIFLDAVALPEAQRNRAVVAAARGRSDVEQAVRNLLRGDSRASRLLPESAAELGLAGAEAVDASIRAGFGAPESIGDIRLTRLIGEGTFGLIYQGEQDRPHRTVAVKLLRPGVASRAAVRRFELEPELMARLKHAGIAQVFQIGTLPAPDARPYFVMEYVDGVPIGEFVRSRSLSTRQIVELMALVCEAVQHAHANQVLHRDLKPANILVTSEGHPKVLDFGVGRLAGALAPRSTFATSAGQVLGTLAYMSPEQAAGGSAGVDSRADVYALGAILYELLSGRLPVPIDGLPIHEGVVAIQNVAPTPLRSLDSSVPMDLDTIVAKSLEKSAERRYATVSEFASDLRRFLNNETVLARRPTFTYQLGKFVRRHRGPVVAAATLAVAAFAALVVVSISFAKERQARIESQSTASVLKDMLESVDPRVAQGRDNTLLLGVLDRAAKQIDIGGLRSSPLAQASLEYSLGKTYRELASFDNAERRLRSAFEVQKRELGDGDELTIASASDLGMTLLRAGRHEDARTFLDDATAGLAQRLGSASLVTLGAMNTLGVCCLLQGKGEEAVRMLQASERGYSEHHPEAHESHVAALANLANAYALLGKHTDAERCFRSALLEGDGFLGERHPHTVVLRVGLGGLLAQTGKGEEALPMLEKAVAEAKVVFADSNPRILEAQAHLAYALNKQGRHVEAVTLFEQTLARMRKAYGPKSVRLVNTLNNMAEAYADADQLAKAEEAITECAELVRAGPKERVALVNSTHGDILSRLEKYGEAEKLLLASHEILLELQGPDAPNVRETKDALVRLYERQGRTAEAEKWRR